MIPLDSSKKVKANPRFFIVLGYILILGVFGGVGTWAAFAKLDSAVVASGVIAIKSNRKVIQHLEGGIIDKILVKEGQDVRSGNVLVKLKDVQAQSNLQILIDRLGIAEATEARLLAERQLRTKISFPKHLIDNPASEVKSVISDQKNIFNDRTDVMNSQIDILNSKIRQLHREAEGISLQKEAYNSRIEILLKRLVRLREGVKNQVVQSNILSTREEEFVELKANIGRLKTEAAKVGQAVDEARLQILQTQQQYKERASTEYKDIVDQVQEVFERIKIAEDIIHRLVVLAPVSGTVQNLKVNTTGGVIRAGEMMMEIVPTDDQLVINAQVSPIDVDNVHPGMETEVRFVAFQGRFLPILTGKVGSVSKDVIMPEDGRTPPYFLARIDVIEEMVPEEIQGRLSAGMPADIIIKVGERTVLDYIISPLADALRKGLREE